MEAQRRKGRDGAVSSLNMAIEAMNLAKEVSSITPAKAVFGTVSALLTMIRVSYPPSTARYFRLTPGKDSMANKLDHVKLGLECADICQALDRGLKGKKLDELSCSVCDAISQLTT